MVEKENIYLDIILGGDMQKTKIEWCDYVFNPVMGCARNPPCYYCYARKLNNRFHWIKDFSKPEWRQKQFEKKFPKKPSRIFVNSMSDVCYWNNSWTIDVLNKIRIYSQHTFMFLTKNPEWYKTWSFSPNCWLGTTVTGYKDWGRIAELMSLKNNNLKFVSIEPVLDKIDTSYFLLPDWIIIGGLSPKPVHKKVWIDEFIAGAKSVNRPIFLKDNLKYPISIKQYPEGLDREN